MLLDWSQLRLYYIISFPAAGSLHAQMLTVPIAVGHLCQDLRGRMAGMYQNCQHLTMRKGEVITCGEFSRISHESIRSNERYRTNRVPNGNAFRQLAALGVCQPGAHFLVPCNLGVY